MDYLYIVTPLMGATMCEAFFMFIALLLVKHLSYTVLGCVQLLRFLYIGISSTFTQRSPTGPQQRPFITFAFLNRTKQLRRKTTTECDF